MLKEMPEQGAVPVPDSAADLDRCLNCGAEFAGDLVFRRYRVCPSCRHHYNLTAAERVELLTDPGTFHETNASLVPIDPLSFSDSVTYEDRLAQAQNVTGLVEGVVTGTAFIGGNEAVVASLDYGFMGGTIGSAVGEKITLAAEMAQQRGLPFVLMACGGAPRMQEGVLALMQMAKMVATVKRLHKKGTPFITVLASPTSGHLLAGPASMADLIIAEPGTLIGFAPKRVAEEATGKPLPKDSHTAEFYLQHGMIDAIIDRQRLKRNLELVLDLLSFKFRLTIAKRARLRQMESLDAPAWKRVQLARHASRPTSRDYIERIVSNFVEFHGDRLYGDDAAVVSGIGYLAGEAVMVIAQERGRGDDVTKCREGRAYPEGYRKAQRAMQLAAKFKLPVVTFIDTPGAYAGLQAEERGIASAISGTMSMMSDLPTPIVSVIIGEGGSEGALALSVADRVLMMENAIYTPIAPEAAAWILFRDPQRVHEVASSLKLTAVDCRAMGIIDSLIPEPEGGAHLDFDESARQLERLLVQALLDVQMTFSRTLVNRRYKKFRKMGNYSTYFEAALVKEVRQTRQTQSIAANVKDVIARALGRGVPPPPVEEVRRRRTT
ncbi:MAG: acetyl-CoA carboxylase carboxyl transferase subunit beta [Chloroflexi bacterium]|nr:acetyl-CoA carboxylase carboxyl transferase subunit beta [Chloroflexota bacterium]